MFYKENSFNKENEVFGSGKTQTSYELNRRIPNSFVYDPENLGFFIKAMLMARVVFS